MLFGMLFCAVSLAIVWGTTLERIKFSAYVIYAVVFAAIIYPLVAHGVYGGGLLSDVGGKPVMDFAGSSVVHLTGAVGGLAALLLLGPRIGKYGADGSPRAIPGHSMPIAGLGVLILWVGWYGFNGGSTFGTGGQASSREVVLNTQLAAAAGALFAMLTVYLKTKTLDVGMAGNGAIAGLVGDHRAVGLRRVLGGADHRVRSPESSSSTACSRSRSTWTIRSVRCRRTAWPASGAPSRSGSSARPSDPRRRRARRLLRHQGRRLRSAPLGQLGVQARRCGRDVRARVRRSRTRRSRRSRLRSACGSPRRRSSPVSTSPRTGCTATRSRSSRRRSTRPAGSSRRVAGYTDRDAHDGGRYAADRRAREEVRK